MSDADYEAFLNKANEGTGETAATQEEKGYGTKGVNTAVPRELESVQETYASEADEPFEPVALNFVGEEVDERDFEELARLMAWSVEKWDPKGRYKSVVDTVKKVVGGEVKVFRVELSGAREEYYVVGVKDRKVLGLKALSVES
ncbi:hypothetical protein BU23DRAFT_587271 [Bimuria novae-zelandiae CBS 107.79]|uniref:Uncharacterized protein n=1 Tax=Bimuria novae-zelandiae CBS 107.79 TaxID=1447943 RepID=A0A6A5VLH2_9PLEO|nr:hypothetical protein BU23DRAFT_587271 [Bimuria novae-zelandiae CBS 107.79]